MVPLVPCPAFVGRSREFESLAAALGEVRAGHGGLVFVVGEAGIGKSRLVHEVALLAAELGIVVLRGRAVPGSETSAFRPLSEALAQVVPDGPLGVLGLEPWLPALAAIVPTVRAPTLATELTVPAQGEAVVRLLRSACVDGGLVVLEDLHWADPSRSRLSSTLVTTSAERLCSALPSFARGHRLLPGTW